MAYCTFSKSLKIASLLTMLALASTGAVQAQAPQAASRMPWMNKALSPDHRADMVIDQMTLDEKIQLVHGTGWGAFNVSDPRSNGGAGFVPGIPRLHIPDINMTDSAVGICKAAVQGRYATLLPSTLGAAASWDPDMAFLYGRPGPWDSTCPLAAASISPGSRATDATLNMPAKTPSSPEP